uniref:Putative ovule protein n=1 Tax=Solanum chacoense TaxID=4108 RepID=A0A0V0HV86_SOLCH
MNRSICKDRLKAPQIHKQIIRFHKSKTKSYLLAYSRTYIDLENNRYHREAHNMNKTKPAATIYM